MNASARSAIAGIAALLAMAAGAQPEAPSGFTPKQAAVGTRFMAAAAHPLAVDAGYAILKHGGTALDAAVAIQLVLGLVEPQSSGLGGGAFILYYSAADKHVRAYDGRETAPAAAQPERFLVMFGRPMGFQEAVLSGRSIGVPGTLAVLELAHQRHGRLAWAELAQPAIALAESGFALSPRLYGLLARDRFLRRDAFAARYLYEPGDLTLADLDRYRAKERDPVCGAFRVYRVCGMPPPSSGGVAVLQILGILERLPRTDYARDPLAAVHLFAEAGRLAYADRDRYLADPDFIDVPVAGLVGGDYLAGRAALVSAERSMRRAPAGHPRGAQAARWREGVALELASTPRETRWR